MAPPPERYITELPADNTPALPAGGLERGKLLYAFTGDGENQLQVSEGAQVTILDDDGAWMTVRRSDGAEGIVPTSYVEKHVTELSAMSPPPSPSPPPRSPSPPAAPPPALASRPERVLEPPPPRAGKRGPPPPVKPRAASRKERKVRALYAYDPQGDDEVEMASGEDFVVIERDLGGWVKVKTKDGREGLVPGTYVEDV